MFESIVASIAAHYSIQAFGKLRSVINKKPLELATERALKTLLHEIENELLDSDFSDDDLRTLEPHVKLFVEHENVQTCLQQLFLEPEYQLDPKIFAEAWNQPETPNLPKDFSWQRIAKRFAREVQKIRNDQNDELKATFDALQQNQNADALQELAGLPPDFDLDQYREALVERFGNLSFDSLDTSGANYNAVRLWSVFVPQSVRESWDYHLQQIAELPKEQQQKLLERGEISQSELEQATEISETHQSAYFEQPLRPVLEVCGDAEWSRMVVLGDPGSGKSTLLRYLALEWARIENATERYTAPLPLLIELRDYNLWKCDSGKSFLRYLHEASAWHRLNQHTLDFLLQQANRVVLLLDGLDEVFDPVQREAVMNDIHRFSTKYKNTRVIVTSRVVGYKPQRLRDAKFRDFMLQDLDEAQIEQFLDRWHEITFADQAEAEKKLERLAKAIQDAKPIQMLAGNPLLLTMMAIINRYQELPRDRVLLYEKAAELLLQQWDTERGLANFPEISKEIDLRAKKAILRKVAFAMQTGKKSNEAANVIQGDLLIDLIEEYLRENLNFTQARAAANVLVRQLRERNFILCFLGSDNYAFVHRTFLEYFCSAEYVHRFEAEKSLDMDGLIQVYDQYCREDDWQEILRLICAQIDAQFVGEIVESLATRTDLEEWDRKEELLEIPLSIYCLGEIKNLSKMEKIGELICEQVIIIFKKESNILEKGSNIIEESLSLRIEKSRMLRKILNKILNASEFLGVRWPGNLEKQLLNFNIDSLFLLGEEWTAFIVAIYRDRRLINKLAKNKSASIRKGAINALSRYWPDSETQKFLRERSLLDGFPASLVGEEYSNFGKIIFFLEPDNGWFGYLDPAQHIAQEHIEKAAEEAGIKPENIDEEVRKLSEHMGWDITKGSAYKISKDETK